MMAHTNSFIVIPARLVPASLTCIRPSQLDTWPGWPKAASGQHHWLWQAACRATGPRPPIRLAGAGPVSLSQLGVNCTATSHLSSRGCSSIRPECAARSAPPRPASQPVSALKRSMFRLGPATTLSWRGRMSVGCWTYVTNLQVGK